MVFDYDIMRNVNKLAFLVTDGESGAPRRN